MPSSAALEGDRHAGEIDQPQPGLHCADLAFGRGMIGEQTIVPEPRGARVMLAPGFDVVHLEAVPLQVRDRHADMIEFAAGKDVAGDGAGLRRCFAEEFALVALGGPRDGVMQIEPVGLEQPVDGREIAFG